MPFKSERSDWNGIGLLCQNPDTIAGLGDYKAVVYSEQVVKLELIPQKKIRFLLAMSDRGWVVGIGRLVLHITHLSSDGVPSEGCLWPCSA